MKKLLKLKKLQLFCRNIFQSSIKLQNNLQQTNNATFESAEDLNEIIKNPNGFLNDIERNLLLRKLETNNITEIKRLINELQNVTTCDATSLFEKLQIELKKLPNKTHPDIQNYNDIPYNLGTFNELPKFSENFKPLEFHEITKKLNLMRMEHLGNFHGHKSYYLMSSLAEMEHALIQYTLNKLKKHNFKLISVPDILPQNIIENCGMQTTGERTQVYKLKDTKMNLCLSGTSEMALAGYFSDKLINEQDLPLKLTAVSRCYRAETSGLQEEKGIYRVHQFTKVEMFSICDETQSENMLTHFRDIEIDLFKELGLHFRLLDMPPSELGNPAYRKYDIESWMSGRGIWGEISSCSNCTDYQAKRLNIRINGQNQNSIKYAHTVNGTACAVPRMLISILETFQKENNTIAVPKVLVPFLRGKTEIKKEKSLPELKLVKSIKYLNK